MSKNLPACTNRKTAPEGYKYDCGACPGCLESIRVLKEQITELDQDDSVVELDSPVCSMSGSERGAA